MMKRISITICLLIMALQVFSSEIKFQENPKWESVLKKAKEENKLIFLNAFTTWCSFCKKMDAEVYTNDDVATYYNDKFINVKYNMEAGEGIMLAIKYNVRSYPASLYIDGDGNVVHKSLGFIESPVFLENGKVANNPDLRWSGVREKALKMSPKDFFEFGASAVKNGDQDYELIAREYLSKHPDVLSDKHLLDIIVQTVNVLPNDKMLKLLVNNKEQVIKVGGYDPSEFEIRLTGLAVSYAIEASTNAITGDQDLAKFNELLNAYIPEKAYFTSNYYTIEYYLRRNLEDEAYPIYAKFLENKDQKSSFNELSNMVIAFASNFPKEDQLQKSFSAIENYPIKEAKDTDNFQKNLVRVLVYLKLHDEANFKIYANKIIEDPNAPKELKSQLENTLDQIESEEGQ